MADFIRKLRPDAWMDWTIIEDKTNEHNNNYGPLVCISQRGQRVHLTKLTATELIEALQQWLAEIPESKRDA